MTEPHDKPIPYPCFLCTQPTQMGRGVYGKYIRQWDITVCSQCYAANHDGIVTSQYPHLMKHLEARKIDVKLNASGRLDWPPF